MEKTQKTIQEVLKLATSTPPQRIPIGEVEINPKNNVREPDINSWDIPSLAESLALEGQSTPVILQKLGKKYLPWQGFRRCSAVRYNAERGAIDPATGAKFSEVLAFVITDELSVKDQYALLLNDGNTRLLNKVELFYAVEKASEIWETEAQIAIALRGLLDLHYPVRKPEVLNDAVAYANYRKGVVQNMLYALRGPMLLREAVVQKLKGKQNWPNTAEVRNLEKSFRTEMKADKTNKISRLKPGKEWMKEWNEFVAKKKDAENEGRKAPSAAMMTGDDVAKAKNASDSRTMKTIMDIVKRKLPQEHLVTIDVWLVDAESGKAKFDDLTKILDSILPPPVLPIIDIIDDPSIEG